jgi:predicted enzyme related to lactoylglutathione lyase
MGITLSTVTIDCADPQQLAAFWSAALRTSVSGDYGDFVFLAPPPGGQVALGFQKVPEPKVGKNRVHVDFGAEDRAAEVARLVELGATVSQDHIGTVPGLDWTTLADPEGNVFCVAQHHSD